MTGEEFLLVSRHTHKPLTVPDPSPSPSEVYPDANLPEYQSCIETPRVQIRRTNCNPSRKVYIPSDQHMTTWTVCISAVRSITLDTYPSKCRVTLALEKTLHRFRFASDNRSFQRRMTGFSEELVGMLISKREFLITHPILAVRPLLALLTPSIARALPCPTLPGGRRYGCPQRRGIPGILREKLSVLPSSYFQEAGQHTEPISTLQKPARIPHRFTTPPPPPPSKTAQPAYPTPPPRPYSNNTASRPQPRPPRPRTDTAPSLSPTGAAP